MSLTPEERAKHAMSQLGDPRTDDVVLLRSVVHNWLVSVLRLAIAEEREALARLCDERAARFLGKATSYQSEETWWRARRLEAEDIAAAIRARP